MELLTKIKLPASNLNIVHEDGIALFGSCFSDNIGNKLLNAGFDTMINPFGIIYNPISIFKSIEQIFKNELARENDLILYKAIYHSLAHHGQFANVDKKELLQTINQQIKFANTKLIGAKFVIFTLGTSSVYTYTATNTIVANCHKLPQHFFEKRFLSIEEIKTSFNAIAPLLKDKTILFTVSPVRHWRDGAIQNQRSKSILIESIHQLIAENKNCHYFPSYEIMMDELRDYRFYAADMLHPNEIAVNYIWEKFATSFFSEHTVSILNYIEKGRLLFNHRVMNNNSAENELFENKKEEFKTQFTTKYPAIKLDFIE